MPDSCRSRVFLEKFLIPSTRPQRECYSESPAQGPVAGTLKDCLPIEVCFLDPALGQKQNKGVYPSWGSLTSLAKLQQGPEIRFWVCANRLYWDGGSAHWFFTQHTFGKENLVPCQCQARVEQMRNCLNLSMDLLAKLIETPWLSVSYCWNSPFPHLLHQTYQFP